MASAKDWNVNMLTMQYNYSDIEPLLHKALYKRLGPHIAVGTEEVDDGRVFLKVGSPQFNGKSEEEKQDIVWEALNALKENKRSYQWFSPSARTRFDNHREYEESRLSDGIKGGVQAAHKRLTDIKLQNSLMPEQENELAAWRSYAARLRPSWSGAPVLTAPRVAIAHGRGGSVGNR